VTAVPADDPGFRDITCTLCDRHNRDVHMVGAKDGLIICAVCVARCAEILDADTGLDGPPGGWLSRWPAKTAGPGPAAGTGRT
jgi:hypothetical protein